MASDTIRYGLSAYAMVESYRCTEVPETSSRVGLWLMLAHDERQVRPALRSGLNHGDDGDVSFTVGAGPTFVQRYGTRFLVDRCTIPGGEALVLLQIQRLLHVCQRRNTVRVMLMVAVTLVAGAAFGQTTAPVCYDGAPTWEGLCVREEPATRTGYVRADHADSEAALILGLPVNLRVVNAAGRTTAFMTPYTCKRFTVDAKGKADTDIEHIVALAEAHDSGLAPSLRHALANDLDNQTVADRTVNRSQKSDKDAADWTPARNGGWFAERVIRVKRRYGLSVDLAEAEALKALLDRGSRALSCP